ncbi:MAG TPA: hypothetical protein DCP92_04460 [Nitrospiraceae bacterium]|nr:hypothetical protein [Nitrospiraceae bacterium]
MNIALMCAFVKLREILSTHKELVALSSGDLIKMLSISFSSLLLYIHLAAEAVKMLISRPLDLSKSLWETP